MKILSESKMTNLETSVWNLPVPELGPGQVSNILYYQLGVLHKLKQLNSSIKLLLFCIVKQQILQQTNKYGPSEIVSFTKLFPHTRFITKESLFLINFLVLFCFFLQAVCPLHLSWLYFLICKKASAVHWPQIKHQKNKIPIGNLRTFGQTLSNGWGNSNSKR